MWTALLALGLTWPAAEPAAAARTFQFTYEAKLTGLPAGATAHIWLPVPPTSADQDVRWRARNCPRKAAASATRLTAIASSMSKVKPARMGRFS